METQTVGIDKDEAAKLWRKYHEHRAYQTPMDAEIERIYKTIARGKTVIRALASITQAGLGLDGLPRLALCRADAKQCFVRLYSDGSGQMTDSEFRQTRAAPSRHIDFPPGAFPAAGKRHYGRAVMPHIPPDIRPARGLANYHILFEAEWSPIPPIDPLLLRRLGKGDTWLVIAAWNLTAVERAAMQARIGQ